MDLMRDKPDNYYALAIVDPPYREKADNSPAYSMKRTGADMKTRFGDKPDLSYFNELRRVSENQIIWGANNFIENLSNTNCFIYWFKRNPVANFSDGELAWTSFGSVSKCFEYQYYGSHSGNSIAPMKIHPTQKPVALYRWLLKNFAKPGQNILDTHGGSFSSAIACHEEGFDLDICELDEDYFNDAVKRFKLNTVQEVFAFAKTT